MDGKIGIPDRIAIQQKRTGVQDFDGGEIIQGGITCIPEFQVPYIDMIAADDQDFIFKLAVKDRVFSPDQCDGPAQHNCTLLVNTGL